MNKGSIIADNLTLDKGWSRLADFRPFPDIDFEALKHYRLGRIRQKMAADNVSLCLLSNPLSLRYAADIRQFSAFQARVPVMYLALSIDGPVIVYGGFGEIESGLTSAFDEVREGRALTVFQGGAYISDNMLDFREDIRSLLENCGGAGSRIAIENMSPLVTKALLEEGYDVIDAQIVMENARRIKTPEEIDCMKWSIAVAEHGMTKMHDALQPGIRENQLWALLNYVNVANDGEWHDSQQLTSGPRTNPFLREASDRAIEEGDLVAFDTDMIGPFGYCADISRTFHCGPSNPTKEQRDLYKRALEQLNHNMSLIKPGVTFEEIRAKAYVVPEGYRSVDLLMHGIGMSDELPFIQPAHCYQGIPPDGVIETGMALCVEAYCGREDGPQGVKLEEQVLVTDHGVEVLTQYPFEQSLML